MRTTSRLVSMRRPRWSLASVLGPLLLGGAACTASAPGGGGTGGTTTVDTGGVAGDRGSGGAVGASGGATGASGGAMGTVGTGGSAGRAGTGGVTGGGGAVGATGGATGTGGTSGSGGRAGSGGVTGTGGGVTGTGGAVGATGGATGTGGVSGSGGRAGTGGVTGTGGGASGTGGAAGVASSPFPLRLSADGRTLVDQSGAPFLFQGEAAWGLIASPTEAEATLYLENRRAKGFNAAIVRLLEHLFAANPPNDADGRGPFTTPGDFSTPNEAYFAHVDRIVAKANDNGILLLLCPAYLGYQGADEGWYQEMTANGVAKLTDYGHYIGDRYKRFTNILWVEAGDYNPPAAGKDLVRAVAQGILDRDPGHFHTAHCGRGNSAVDCFGSESWLSVNSSYTSFITYQKVLQDHDRSPFKPFFLLDAEYENENQERFGFTQGALRAQAYWAILSGAQGQDFGNNPVWGFGHVLYPQQAPYTWQMGLESAGSRQMPLVTALFKGRPWHELTPDAAHRVVTAGFGSAGDSDYVTAARTPDGRLVMVYVPTTTTGAGARSITVDMTQLAAPAAARWYNPTDGSYRAVAGAPLANTGTRSFTTPGDNGTGTSDWALVIEAE